MISTGKIVLGTVQFGLNYGINNQTGQVSPEEINSILSLAIRSGINTLDTSSAYGESETSIGNSLRSNLLNFNIITKYPKSEQSVQQSFKTSLSRLGKKNVYGYLIHHFDFYQAHPEIWNDFIELKKQGLVSKIGFSIYSPDQLLELLDRNVPFDLIQFPYNIFDRQFEPYLNTLKQSGVEIHTRSVFLQGLFFKELSSLNGKLKLLRPYLEKLNLYCKQKNKSIEQLTLNYVANNPAIDGILIGVDSCDQLQRNIHAASAGIDNTDIDFITSLNIIETDLLNPVNWI
jgi:aryl-alcohol dehydrogenase-like predicted oxidoreductase